MILDSKPVYQVDGVSLDPYQSTLTYRGTGNERTTTYYDLYSIQSMVPMTLTVLAEGPAPVRPRAPTSLPKAPSWLY